MAQIQYGFKSNLIRVWFKSSRYSPVQRYSHAATGTHQQGGAIRCATLAATGTPQKRSDPVRDDLHCSLTNLHAVTIGRLLLS